MKQKLETITQEQFDKLISFLNKKGIQYALLGEPTGKNIIASDLDLCANDIKRFDTAIREYCSYDGKQLITKRYHATGIRYNYTYKYDNDTYIFPGPDLLIFPTWHIKKNISLSYDKLIANRIFKQNKYYPSDVDAFIYYFIKRVDKGKIEKKQGSYLTKLWKQNPRGIRNTLSKFFSNKNIELISAAANENNWKNISIHMPQLIKELVAQKSIPFKRIIWILKRTVRRIILPTGLFIVFLGSDGSGKSSVIASILKRPNAHFTNTKYVHLRPRLGLKKGNGTIVTEPHNVLPRSTFVSIIKLLYFIFDYGIGFLIKIKPLLLKPTLVIFDRYYYDLLIDPKRYRYGAPIWIASFIAKFIPKPELVILLDAPPDVLQARKQEVPLKETARQRKAYLQFVTGLSNGIVIDAAKPLKQVVDDTNLTIFKFLTQRIPKRY